MFFAVLAIIAKVLLTILKILLFLFAFFVFIIGLILFVPVRYRFGGSYHGNDMKAEGTVSWLMHLVSVRFRYNDGETSYILKIAGIKILPRKTKNKQKPKVAQKPKDEQKPKVEPGHNKIKPQKSSKTIAKNEIEEASENKTEPKLPKKATDLFKKVIEAVKKIFAAVRSGKEKAVIVKEFVFGQECLSFVCVVRDNVLHLWRHIKPKFLKIDMTIGFDDPAVTGQVLGVIAAFCGAAGIMPCVTPDFEKQVFESDIKIKGRVAVFILLKILIKVYFCEELKEFKKSYKSIREVL